MATEKMETEAVESKDPAAKPYTPGENAIDISPNQDRKILKEIVVEGEGNEYPAKGDKVCVHYIGRLLDGTVFDSSIDRGEMFEFTIGKGEVIKAWDIGVATMKKLEKCFLTCHPDYAYGKEGSPPKIPENATLVFEIQLFKWKMEDLSPEQDNSILRSTIIGGEGYITPNEGAQVEIHLVGKYDDKQFEERDLKFELGEGSECNVVEGLEIALKKFKKGEQSKVILAPKYAFGAAGNPGFNIPPHATIEYTVTLKSFEKAKESWDMSPEEKLEQSEIIKNKGTKHFKDGKFLQASKQYEKIIDHLQYESKFEGEQKEKRDVLLCAGYLNVAACQLKLENCQEVIKNCEKALEIEPKSVKGLFRKGQAHEALRDYESAKECFEKVIVYDSSNKAAQKSLYSCKEKMKKELEKEKKMYQNIFKKMAEQAEKEPSAAGDAHNQENGIGEKMESEQTTAEAV